MQIRGLKLIQRPWLTMVYHGITNPRTMINHVSSFNDHEFNAIVSQVCACFDNVHYCPNYPVSPCFTMFLGHDQPWLIVVYTVLFIASSIMVDRGHPKCNLTFMVDHGQPWSFHCRIMVDHGHKP